MRVELTDVFDTLQVYLGGYYVNDFNRFGRTWQVYVQAEGEFRTRAENVGQFRVLNSVGDDVEVALDSFEDGSGETRLSREKAKRARTWTRRRRRSRRSMSRTSR